MTTAKEIPISELLSQAKKASTELATLSSEKRSLAVDSMAKCIEERKSEILIANEEDVRAAEDLLKRGEITKSMVDRLHLNETKIAGIIDGLRQVAHLPDPVGSISLARELDEGLVLYRVTTPIGLIAVIFESRPDALPQIASLAIRTGNAAVLKGGREASKTLTVLFDCLQEALARQDFPAASLTLLKGREDVETLLEADELIDLIIPRGSNQLVKHIQDNTRIPVLGHAEGICHLYIHDDADTAMAVKLIIDAKTQYPAACNTIETLLVNANLAVEILPLIARELLSRNVQLRADKQVFEIISQSTSSCDQLTLASAEDWSTEYSDLILSVKVVSSLEEAIEHVNRFGSHHTETIVTASQDVYEAFFKGVNSAGVFLNASTRFSDGFRYGFGAEVGISTGKLHPRGPVGMDGLVTYKYKLLGHGHTVTDYSGESGRKFTHRDIEM